MFNSLYDININSITGQPIDLNEFKNKKILFVNVASKCSFTKQYNGLEQLHQKYNDSLVVIGLPCNQFGDQEPGSLDEIRNFCKFNYNVNFLLTEKISVIGYHQHDLYKWLTNKKLNGKKNSTVRWNFQKYLIDENGKLINYFYSTTNPCSPKITKHLNLSLELI